MWRNWACEQVCEPQAYERPTDVAGVSTALERAASAGHNVRVAGSGHSFSAIVPTDGALIDIGEMRSVLDSDRESGLVRVEAGITLQELNARLADLGRALENLGDIDRQTIAGAISTATHGTGSRLRNISAQVDELELVLADGSRLRCSADTDEDIFRAARVSVGSLGVIVGVTLRTVPAFTLERVDAPAALDETLEHLDALVDAAEHFEFFSFPHSPLALTRTIRRVEGPPRPPGALRRRVEDVWLGNYAFAMACRAGRAFPAAVPLLSRTVARAMGSAVRVDRSDRAFASVRRVKFTEMEQCLPREHAAEAVRRVRAICDSDRHVVNFPIELRFVAADDAFLSPSIGRDSAYLAVHAYSGMAWEPYFREVEAALAELGARPHWGKRSFLDAAALRERYPDWDRWQGVRARLDPGGRFESDWTRHALGPIGVAAPAR